MLIETLKSRHEKQNFEICVWAVAFFYYYFKALEGWALFIHFKQFFWETKDSVQAVYVLGNAIFLWVQEFF